MEPRWRMSRVYNEQTEHTRCTPGLGLQDVKLDLELIQIETP